MKSVFSVRQINSYIKNMFTQDYLLHSVLVRGEVSNCKYHSSGHIYFTLKDESGTLSCVMFAGNRRGLSYPMKEGDQVIAAGSVDVYGRDGKYQLYATRIIADGAGALNERYERLKKQLGEQGLFDEAYKQPIPRYIRTLGVVTAPTGAAVQDILNISLRRNPYLQILLYPAQVQGAGAAQSIVNGIRALEAAGVDVMIIGRGGGSLEDLWAFNEECVAQAVFDCSVPVISAVGHETDTVITDYVADLRAPTPSAAAELAVFEFAQFEEDLRGFRDSLTLAMNRRLGELRSRTALLERAVWHGSPVYQIRDRRMYAAQLEERLQNAMERTLLRDRHRIGLLAGRLDARSPLAKLSGGYGYLRRERDGKPLQSVEETAVGDRLLIRLRDGSLEAQVSAVQPDERQGMEKRSRESSGME
ncbi:MAG: exodeoxyribonuclease VII large subunit [Eubacteriales bacterium]|nr:exodeoxyribonuclease VII large subunit [Eubacteriales bacterium]